MIKSHDKKYLWGSGLGSGDKVCYRNVRNFQILKTHRKAGPTPVTLMFERQRQDPRGKWLATRAGVDEL